MMTAIVLAAGTSSRMGEENKLLLPLAGKTSVQLVVENILAAGIEEVIVVTGHEAAQVQTLLQNFPVSFVHNPNYKTGMTTSIQAGVSVAKGYGFMICLSDMPFITGDDYQVLKTFFEETRRLHPGCICQPRYKGRRGHPVVFSTEYRKEILQHKEPDGCKEILLTNAASIHFYEADTNHYLRDMDTVEDYQSVSHDLQAQAQNNSSDT